VTKAIKWPKRENGQSERMVSINSGRQNLGGKDKLLLTSVTLLVFLSLGRQWIPAFFRDYCRGF
jgi:hypothetical protein